MARASTASELSPEIKSFPDFFQEAPRIGNTFADDSFLQAVLQRLMKKEMYEKVKPDLVKFGGSGTHTTLASLCP